jgi:hypothetical protein
VAAGDDVTLFNRGRTSSRAPGMPSTPLGAGRTACGAGGRPGCSAPPSVSRYFLRFTAPGWRVVARTAAGGCRAVLAVAPDFPRALCAHLPPTLK